MPSRLRVVWPALLLAAVAAAATAQVPSPSGRPRRAAPAPEEAPQSEVQLNADLVLVSAVVTRADDGGRVVRDLKSSDFVVLDEGVPQQIAFFGGETVPLDVAFLFDASESLQFRQRFQREALAAFLRSLLRPADRAAVLWFNERVHTGQQFTSAVGALLAAIDRIPSGGATALYDAVGRAAGEMSGRAGRRAIVVLSDGRDTFSNSRLEDALAAAIRAEAVVYAINTSYAGWAVTDEFRRNDPLEYLAAETGGEVFYTSGAGDVERTLSLLSSRLRERYLLGFYPSDPGPGGRFRRLRVSVGRKNARVLARGGYYAR